MAMSILIFYSSEVSVGFRTVRRVERVLFVLSFECIAVFSTV